MMKKITIIILLIWLVITKNSLAQTSTQSTDNQTEIIELLAKAEDLITKGNYDSVTVIAENALYLAQQLAIDTLIGQSYRSLAKVAYYSNNYHLADSFYNLAINYFQNDKVLASIYLGKMKCHVRWGNIDSLPKYLDLAKTYLDKIEGSKNPEILEYYNRYAYYYSIKNLVSKEVDYLFKAKEVAITEADFFSVDYYLSTAFMKIGEYDYSMELLLKNKRYAVENKNIEKQFSILFGLTYNRLQVEDYEGVKKFANEAIKLSERNNQSSSIGFIYACLGENYILENKLDSAAYYLKEGIKISQRRNEKKELVDNYTGMVYLASKEGDIAALKFYGNEIKKLDFYSDEKVNTLLANQYAKEGNYRKAYEFIMVNWNEDQKGTSSDKNKIISSLISDKVTQKNKLEQLELEKQLEHRRYQLALSLGLGGFALLIIVGMIWTNRQSRKRNELLQKDLENKKLIESQAAELQKTDALKSRLFANISHELRTPLTLISSPIKNLLRVRSLDDTTKIILRGVLTNSEQLLNMSTQIMELTKTEIKKIEVVAKAFSLHNILQYIRSKFQLLANTKGIDLKIPNLHNKDISLITDAKKLETILSNLISNALKYIAEKGMVSIQITELADQVKITVADNGRGIAKADLPFIFDRYYQAKNGEIRAEGGVGIGLAICKEYIHLLEGSISVESELGKGSEFTIQFPKQLKGVAQMEYMETMTFSIPQIDHNLPTVLNSPTQIDYILIVEDNLKMCAYLKTVLEADYDLLFCHNGKEALQRIEQKVPSLIITDLMMPVMSGMELISKIKEQHFSSRIPILVLTAKNDVLVELKALRKGVDDYLMKPFDDMELKTNIYNLLHFAEARKNIKEVESDYLKTSKIQTSIKEDGLNQADRNWLMQIEELITKLATKPDLNIDTLAKELTISTSLLYMKMRSITGLTPKKYINEIRLLLGRKMIENKEYTSVKAIAYSVGYNSEKVFSRHFKARFGRYPSAYLRQDKLE